MVSLHSHTHTDLDGLSAKDVFLTNPDLLEQTFSHLQAKNIKEYRLCLFYAALTCKSFLHAALDALWKELDSLMPLLKLLPVPRIKDAAHVCTSVLHVFSIQPHIGF